MFRNICKSSTPSGRFLCDKKIMRIRREECGDKIVRIRREECRGCSATCTSEAGKLQISVATSEPQPASCDIFFENLNHRGLMSSRFCNNKDSTQMVSITFLATLCKFQAPCRFISSRFSSNKRLRAQALKNAFLNCFFCDFPCKNRKTQQCRNRGFNKRGLRSLIFKLSGSGAAGPDPQTQGGQGDTRSGEATTLANVQGASWY